MTTTAVAGGLCASLGFQASGLHCGLKVYSKKPDLALVSCETPCTAAAVYTQNKVKGAPILITQKHLADGQAQAIIVNSGNANTCNLDGEEVAIQMCQLTAQELGLAPQDIIVASTGIIGQSLPIDPIASHLPALKAGLSPQGNDLAAQAILTTDLVEKVHAISFELGGKTCHIGGIAKGSGMIHPNMATMLCFLTSDVKISAQALDKALKAVVQDTFNMISVDGDTSTNDMVSLMASGLAGNQEISHPTSQEFQDFQQALYQVMEVLCKKIAHDGEGASKLLTCHVSGGGDKATAKEIAKSVITSSLFKCAIFGKDPNWGRILCAIGYTPGDFDINLVEVSLQSQLGRVQVCLEGRGVDFDNDQASLILSAEEVVVDIHLHQGQEQATAWGCDLTYDYVKINADYHT